MAEGFFWGNDPNVNQQLRQRIAMQMLSQKKGYPKTLGEGLTAIGDSIGDIAMMRRLEQADLAAQAVQPPAPPSASPASYAPSDDVSDAPAVKAIDRAITPPTETAAPETAPAPDLTTAPQQPASALSPKPMSGLGGAAGPMTARDRIALMSPRTMLPSAQRVQPAAEPGVSDGGYNSIDAQAGGRFKPTPGYMQDAIAAREPNPDMQAYYGSLSGSEAKNAQDVSPTGAAGPFQFTHGTGAQYGIPGAARTDPGASTDAVRALTADNAAAFEKINGRAPTYQELALMHQQGGVTGARMAAGTGNASPNNLAVNNIPPGASPQTAVAKINGFYGMPSEAAPVRDAVASAMVAQQQPDQRLALAPTGRGTATDAAPAPVVPSGIQKAPPPVQVAQAQPQAVPGYVTQPPGDPTGAPIVKMSPYEATLRQWVATQTARGNLYAGPKVAAQLQAMEQERTIRQNEANELHKANIARQTKALELRETQRADQAKREQEYQKGAQDIIAPGAPGAAGNDPRLGTPQSPQRSGVPNAPPVPPGITPQKWNELQAPVLVKAVDAVEKATPAFDEMMKTLKLARDHPGREWGIGATSEIAKRTPGTAAYGFGKIMEQIGGKNFLNAYQQLKGGGAITEVEGTKAEAAQARLATAQNKDDFDKAMKDFEDTVRSDLETVQRKVNRPVTAWQRSNEDPPAPDKGQIVSGFSDGRVREYLGGKPSDLKGSWRIVQ